MEYPVIAIYHRPDGFKEMVLEHPAGVQIGKPAVFCQVTATKIAEHLLSSQGDGEWVRIPVLVLK